MKKAIWWILFIGYAGAIFAGSSLSLRGESTLFPFPQGDKLAHFLEFGLFMFLAFKALPGRRALAYAFTVTAVYAGSDEFHQIFVPFRDPCFADWAADVVGAAVMSGVIAGWHRLASARRSRILRNYGDQDRD